MGIEPMTFQIPVGMLWNAEPWKTCDEQGDSIGVMFHQSCIVQIQTMITDLYKAQTTRITKAL